MNHATDHAVSPVVGVMLMLVVTIIIAALVSSAAGGFSSSQNKPCHATIGGEFSISQGMQIIHDGGDTLPMTQIVFTTANGPTFGSGVRETTTQVLNMTGIVNSEGTPVKWANGYNVTAFRSGETFFIAAANTNCNVFQPLIAPYDYATNLKGDGYTFTGSKKGLWSLCFRNNDNIGKSFTLMVSDVKGNMISSSDVKIVP